MEGQGNHLPSLKVAQVLFEILCVQTPSKAHAAYFWPEQD